jgi:hypothetical protein
MCDSVWSLSKLGMTEAMSTRDVLAGIAIVDSGGNLTSNCTPLHKLLTVGINTVLQTFIDYRNRFHWLTVVNVHKENE